MELPLTEKGKTVGGEHLRGEYKEPRFAHIKHDLPIRG